MKIKFKSKLEEQFSKVHKLPYEPDKLPYTLAHTYTPDWKISSTVYLETKGRFLSSDRTKMIAVLKQHPELTIAMVFQNSKIAIRKNSKTTYADWCDKHSIIWFDSKDTTKINRFINKYKGT